MRDQGCGIQVAGWDALWTKLIPRPVFCIRLSNGRIEEFNGAGVGIHPPGREFPLVRYGGSRQYFMQGKRVGNTAFLKTVYLSNGSASLTGSSNMAPRPNCGPMSALMPPGLLPG